MLKKNIFNLFLVIFIFFSDRLSKSIILNLSEPQGNLNISITSFMNFNLIWNDGIGFGLLSLESSIYYNFLSILIGLVIVLLIFVGIKSNKFEKFFFSMVIGGALGNFYDRIVYFAVPDFIDIHYQRFHWFTFNIADIFITIGIFLLLIKELFLANGKD